MTVQGLAWVELNVMDGSTSIDLVGLLGEVHLLPSLDRIIKCGELIQPALDAFNAELFVNQQRLALFAVKVRRIVRDAHAQGVLE